MGTLYDIDIVAWAEQQAALLRAGRFSELDVENIVDEIDALACSERRELESRLAVLLVYLLKWRLQPGLQGGVWQMAIKNRREEIGDHVAEVPSLKHTLEDEEFLQRAWRKACRGVEIETGLPNIPDSLPWSLDQILDPSFLPEN